MRMLIAFTLPDYLSINYYDSLHSKEARLRMTSYQIGQIGGRWQNFLPPIQGGKFRSYPEELEENSTFESDIEAPLNSSGEASQSPSPLFEPVNVSASFSRQRTMNRTPSASGRTSPTSSISSMENDALLPASSSGQSHLDSRTRKELDLDLSKYPNLAPSVQDEIVRKYRALDQRIREEGLYQCNYTAYLFEAFRYTLLFVMCLLSLHYGWYSTSGVFLGAFWHQLVFTGHDAGHMGITHNFQVDTIIGIIVADFMGGLSIGWWKRNHNVHHIVTNSPEHDPDIEHMPFFAVSHRFLSSLRSTYYEKVMRYDTIAQFTIRYQNWLYYPLLTFGRFNLYRLGWEYLILGQGPKKGPAWWHRWFEILGQVFFWTWYGYGMVYCSIPNFWGRFVFIMISHMITMPLHLQITLSHFGMSTADLGVDESFPQRMLRTTMDIECPAWLDFFHGGLQFQAIHHLYPRIPRHNLRRTQKLVQDFCNEVNIPYALYGFIDGNKEVIGRLADVGRQAAILAECQKKLVEKDGMNH